MQWCCDCKQASDTEMGFQTIHRRCGGWYSTLRAHGPYRLLDHCNALPDAMAFKGVVYACILKAGKRFHVFASHTQAWQEQKHEKVTTTFPNLPTKSSSLKFGRTSPQLLARRYARPNLPSSPSLSKNCPKQIPSIGLSNRCSFVVISM